MTHENIAELLALFGCTSRSRRSRPRWLDPRRSTNHERNPDFPSLAHNRAGVNLICLHQPVRSGPADDWWGPDRRRQRGCNWGCRCRWTWCRPRCCGRRSRGCGGRPYHYSTAASVPLLNPQSPSALTCQPNLPHGVRCSPASNRGSGSSSRTLSAPSAVSTL